MISADLKSDSRRQGAAAHEDSSSPPIARGGGAARAWPDLREEESGTFLLRVSGRPKIELAFYHEGFREAHAHERSSR